MTNRDTPRFSLSLTEKVGLGACGISVLLAFADVRLAIVPLACFLLLCTVAPFLPRAGLFLPVISRGKSGKRAIAITFDDGPDPLSTPELLKLLQKHGTKATFFVTGKRASRYPEVVRQILSFGHSLGNHTYSHDNLIMIRDSKTLREEIESAQKVLMTFGIKTHVFRPPAGVTSPRLRPILQEFGLSAINFSCRALDGGNRRIDGLSRKILERLRPDAIIVLHDTRPRDERLLAYWLEEIELILEGIKKKGFAVLPLAELIGKPVMTAGADVVKPHEQRIFLQHIGSDAR
jgi:peptidoglycan/xylan/chitin deacetylase (PgdA/CDA1 family)